MVGAPARGAGHDPDAAEAPRRQRRARAVRSGQSVGSRTSAAAAGRSGPIRTSCPPNQVAEQLDQFLVAAGAVGRINDAGREHGQIRAFNNRTFDVAKAVPTVVMRNEDYGRISRILADGTPVELELNIVNRTYPGRRHGLQRRRRDSRHRQGAGSGDARRPHRFVALGHRRHRQRDRLATMLEAIRILQAIGVKPRRTIRVALWSGEEQGLLGSQAYVKEHFGMVENPKPEHANFAGYFNIDSGTGRARGMSVFGPPEAARDPARSDASRSPTTASSASTPRSSRRRGGTDSHVVQRGGPARHRHPAGSDRIRLAHVAHQPRHLRADHRETTRSSRRW